MTLIATTVGYMCRIERRKESVSIVVPRDRVVVARGEGVLLTFAVRGAADPAAVPAPGLTLSVTLRSEADPNQQAEREVPLTSRTIGRQPTKFLIAQRTINVTAESAGTDDRFVYAYVSGVAFDSLIIRHTPP
ncbi:MAG: hypothetical protein K2Q20_08980 [Phycisphaerales bacterium]|nr:hypothetical protein [Phycisphaerales bacterium]